MTGQGQHQSNILGRYLFTSLKLDYDFDPLA